MTETPLITIEGIDKAGKGTLVSALKDKYPNAFFTREPDDEEWTSNPVRRAIQSEGTVSRLSVFHFFLADHHTHVDNKIRPNLSDSSTSAVICDRYIDSRYAYQSILLNDVVNGDTFEWIQTVQQGSGATVVPDLTILLDISAEESVRRTSDEEDTEMFEKRDFLSQVRDQYLHLATEVNPERFAVVDAEQSKEEVLAESIAEIDSVL